MKLLFGTIVFLSVLFLSCEDAEYDLNNPNDPENMDLDPPALFFHPGEINTKLDSSFTVQLYGLKLGPTAASHLDIRYERNSVRVDSVIADTFFQNLNEPFQVIIDDEENLDIFLYLLPDTLSDQNEGGTWSLATIHFTAISTGGSELLYGEDTRLRDANNDSVRIKSFGTGFINVE
ncbi:MAG: hypothetical protein CMG57_02530 [Candidatus Marinimicrobia bacterium]|nr:hypothetical protein [Candidatus Neomarinimicrobiota bacterium]|tara:strand:+ start:162 stop:692 length:531 start_codon:yes stop_codon:yes gene_type:complete